MIPSRTQNQKFKIWNIKKNISLIFTPEFKIKNIHRFRGLNHTLQYIEKACKTEVKNTSNSVTNYLLFIAFFY